MKTLLINLAQAKDRLRFQEAQFRRLDMSFERVEALAGFDVDQSYYKKMYTSGQRIISKNEAACFLSHLKCWEICVQSGEPVFVLEDDAVVSDVLPNVLNELGQKIDRGANIVCLEWFGPKKRVSNKVFESSNPEICVYDLVFAGPGAAAYIIWPEAAKLCLAKAERQMTLADLFLYSVRGTRILQTSPALAMQLCMFGEEGKIGVASESLINAAGTNRPSGFESFITNPMTRVRRLKGWFETVWCRHLKPVQNKHVRIAANPELLHSLQKTKALLGL